ncbi:hypothetical protein [Streptomyces sp. NPDC057686]|uniref:hypothetical protein n=1 Tax=Streptomyces sp. NPDC057686 TaxID=3346212 RepID=UPI0036C6650A
MARSGNGFDVEAYERLRRALRRCAEAWAGYDAIPREGANVLVDVFPATETNAGLYEGEAADQVRDAAYELHDLVSACVALSDVRLWHRAKAAEPHGVLEHGNPA